MGTLNPLLRHLLAETPPGGAAADGPCDCPVCCLGLTAAGKPARGRLALIPEFTQAALNALVNQLAPALTAATDGGPDHRRQQHLWAALVARAAATQAALPFTATPFILRQTLRALPVDQRDALLPELAALRYLVEPDDPALAAGGRQGGAPAS